MEFPSQPAFNSKFQRLNYASGYYDTLADNRLDHAIRGLAANYEGFHFISLHASSVIYALVTANDLLRDPAFMPWLGTPDVSEVDIVYSDVISLCAKHSTIEEMLAHMKRSRCPERQIVADVLSFLIFEVIYYNEVAHIVGGHIDKYDLSAPAENIRLYERSALELEADAFAASIMAKRINYAHHDSIENSAGLNQSDTLFLHIIAHCLILGAWAELAEQGSVVYWDGYPPPRFRVPQIIFSYAGRLADYGMPPSEAQRKVNGSYAIAYHVGVNHPQLAYTRIPLDDNKIYDDSLEVFRRALDINPGVTLPGIADRDMLQFRYYWHAQLALPWGYMVPKESDQYENLQATRTLVAEITHTCDPQTHRIGDFVVRITGIDLNIAIYAPLLLDEQYNTDEIALNELRTSIIDAVGEYGRSATSALGDQALSLLSGLSELVREFVARRKASFQARVTELSQLISTSNQDALLYIERGQAYQVLDMHDSALDDFNQAAVLTPDSHEIYFFRGNTLSQIGLYELAIKDYDRAEELKEIELGNSSSDV